MCIRTAKTSCRAADRHRVSPTSDDIQLVIPSPVPADRLVNPSVRADKLIIPPPLPALAERQEMLVMNGAHNPGKKWAFPVNKR